MAPFNMEKRLERRNDKKELEEEDQNLRWLDKQSLETFLFYDLRLDLD
jgi:hypothetical protein